MYNNNNNDQKVHRKDEPLNQTAHTDVHEKKNFSSVPLCMIRLSF